MNATLLIALLSAAVWNFDKDKEGSPPAGFEFTTTTKAPAAKWVVKKDGTGSVLAQVETETPKRFASAIVKGSRFKDVRVSARMKTISGYQAPGVVWRYQDADNYYVARSNPIEKNVYLFKVVAGKRTKLGGLDTDKVRTGAWHTLRVEHKGPSIVVYLNDQKIIEASDGTFAEGAIGVWIKDDTVAYFDDLKAEALQ
jgi:hypothetical protein